MDNEVLRAVVKQNPNNTIYYDYAEELGVTPTIISRHLKLIYKVQKMDKWVPHEMNENQKNKCFETSSALLCNQNDPFLNRIATRKVDSVRQSATFIAVAGY
ncbi:histone-lysine N-methyltransferase SETMAR [Trichonephila clavata]|uniref:Histone-lysine N-methyltransferase SETMAR n=1 Tax=Trichonephila clavata TaxID=2740835 RepID=A0A8X6H0A3_TRICU|nr:histone-lysine N-methyltransferase SETMAR [Trichonephila clavata]